MAATNPHEPTCATKNGLQVTPKGTSFTSVGPNIAFGLLSCPSAECIVAFTVGDGFHWPGAAWTTAEPGATKIVWTLATSETILLCQVPCEVCLKVSL